MVFLEHQLDRHMAAKQQEAEESNRNLRRMQERLRHEEVEMMRAMGGVKGPGGTSGVNGPSGFGGKRGNGSAGGDGLSDSESDSGSSTSSGGEVELGPGANKGQ
eukprot:SAG31_NODE_8688_length_1405_cov_22.982048_1_plen_103_part_10